MYLHMFYFSLACALDGHFPRLRPVYFVLISRLLGLVRASSYILDTVLDPHLTNYQISENTS